MKKKTHLIYSFILLIFINGCVGYEPIFRSGNIQFKIADYSVHGNKILGNKIYSKLLKEENCIIVVQVDGRKRGILEMPINSKETMIIKKSKEIDNVSRHVQNTTIIKNIYIKNKLVNFITKK